MSKAFNENKEFTSYSVRSSRNGTLSTLRRGSIRLGKSGLLACATVVWALACDAQPVTNCVRLDKPGLLEFSATGLLPPSFDNPSTNVFIANCLQPILVCGKLYTNLWVNQDGNVTLDDPFGGHFPPSYEPSLPLTNLQRVIFAPFWADVDTTTNGSGTVQWGCLCVLVNSNNRSAFGVTWQNVGYYKGHNDKTNSFQMLIIERSDLGFGCFDLQYRYGSIQWDTGDSADGKRGLCDFGAGIPARVGFAIGAIGFELPGSGRCGALLDNGPNSLLTNRLHSAVNGVYTWHFTATNCLPEP